MNNSYQQKLKKNIIKYSWFKIFAKRVYLPVIALQLVNAGKVTLEQLALITAIVSAVQIVLQIPSGYIADKWGDRGAILLGAAITVSSPLFYIFMPNFTGGLIAALLFFGGYAFQSGAIEAFMHDTLSALGREKDYAQIMGRAQSYGLIGNIVLITLVPATYHIHTSLPFILGFISLLIMLGLAISFTYPQSAQHKAHTNPFAAAKSIVTTHNIVFFIFAGFMAGVAQSSPQFRELLLQDLGVNVVYFGAILALGSLMGAIMARCIHHLVNLKPLIFYFADLAIIAVSLMIIGLTRHPALAIAGFTLLVGYSRVRMIGFQAKLLEDIKHAYKATLLSTLAPFTLLGDIAGIALLARFITDTSYTTGYWLFGLCTFGIGLLLWVVIFLEARFKKAGA